MAERNTYRGTHTRWQLVANDATGVLTPTDMGAGVFRRAILTLEEG